jgi:hypothetical protein
VAPSCDEPPPIDEAAPEAMGAQVNGDTLVAAPVKWSQKKASDHNKNPAMFGNWTLKHSPPSHESLRHADAMAEHRANGVDGREDLEVF